MLFAAASKDVSSGRGTTGHELAPRLALSMTRNGTLVRTLVLLHCRPPAGTVQSPHYNPATEPCELREFTGDIDPRLPAVNGTSSPAGFQTASDTKLVRCGLADPSVLYDDYAVMRPSAAAPFRNGLDFPLAIELLLRCGAIVNERQGNNKKDRFWCPPHGQSASQSRRSSPREHSSKGNALVTTMPS